MVIPPSLYPDPYGPLCSTKQFRKFRLRFHSRDMRVITYFCSFTITLPLKDGGDPGVNHSLPTCEVILGDEVARTLQHTS